jgi:flagellar biosynthesis protein FlhA
MADKKNKKSLMSILLGHMEITISFCVIGVVIMMIIPLPGWILDLLLTVNIAASILIFLLTMDTVDALDLSVFPSALLVLTLFRLALNVSSTRLILLNGKNFDSKIIRAFGDYVVGGNYIVGIIVFTILVVIQFLVITKGATRVAEVQARFTLDAMPGKQMAIDAELNSGAIQLEEAQEKREKLRREADFFGTMDGASKFVQGDAIAGIVITIINIIGGILIGVFMNDMGMAEAGTTYTILTVGDGLSSQVPALLISTATGILITRSASKTSLGAELGDQFLSQPKILGMASILLVFLAFMSGLPVVPLLSLSGVLGTFAFFLNAENNSKLVEAEAQIAQQKMQRAEKESIASHTEEMKKPGYMRSLLKVEDLELEIGFGLIPLVDSHKGGDLLERITMIRRQIAIELGLIVPPIRIRDNTMLKGECYAIKIKGLEVAKSEIYSDCYLAMNPGGAVEKLTGIETVEPAFNLPAVWIKEDQRAFAESAGYTVVDPPSVLATHLSEVIKRNAYRILGREGVKELLTSVKETNPSIAEEAKNLQPGLIQKVLENLLMENVSIKNMPTILEVLVDHSGYTHDPELLSELCRQSLGGYICSSLANEEGFVPVITVSNEIEESLSDAIRTTESGGEVCAVSTDIAQKLMRTVKNVVNNVEKKGYIPVIICSPRIRRHLKQLIQRVIPNVSLLSFNEITPETEIQQVGMISI